MGTPNSTTSSWAARRRRRVAPVATDHQVRANLEGSLRRADFNTFYASTLDDQAGYLVLHSQIERREAFGPPG